MVSRRDDLETRLIATDDASKVIDKVADKYEKIPDQVDTTIAAEDKATPQLRSIVDRLEGLSKEDQTIVLQASAKDAQREIDRILRALGRVHDMDDDEVQIRIEALDKAKGDLDRIQAEMADLDGETAEVHVEATGLDGILTKLDSLPGKFGEMGSALSGALGPIAAGGGVTAGVVAIAAGLAAAANAAADTALEAATMSKLTGDTVEDASKLQQIWQTTGADVNDLNDIVVQLNGALKQSPEMASKLGINLDDGKTALQRFVQVVDLADKGLVSMTDQSTLFGEEGIRQVAGLTTRYEDLSQVIADMEPPVTKEDAEQALVLKQAISDLTTEFHKLALEIGQVAVPALEEALHKAEPFLKLLGLMGDQIEKSGDKAKSGVVGWKEADEMFAAGFSNIDEWRKVQPIFAGIDAAVAGTADSSADLADATGKLSAQQKLYNLRLALTLVQLSAYSNDQADAAEHAAEVMDKVKELAAALIQASIDVPKAQVAFDDLAGTFEQMGVKGEALQSIFDLKNAPLDAAGQVRDITQEIEDLSTAAEGVDLSQPLDPSNVDADKLLDAFDQLRPQIQAKIVEAFEGGGTEAATKMAQDYIAQVAEELGISDEEAAHLLGLDNIQATIHVALDQTALANAKRELAILVGLGGETPLTASIALGLETGDITPQQAQILIQQKLGEAGVDIPASLQVTTTPEEFDAALAAAGIGPKHPFPQPADVVIPDSTLQNADGTIQAGPHGNGWSPIEVKIVPIVDRFLAGLGLGVGATGAAAAAPAARMLGAAPTATVTTAPLKMPATAGAGGQTVVIYNTLQAGTIGAPFDVMYAMDQSSRRFARLMPKVP